MNFSNEIHVDTVHVVRRYVVELLYTLPWESLAWDIAQLETQIANLPKWSSDEITRLRKKKILARAIGGATYVNWKHDIYRNHLPALILSTSRRTSEEMCQSHNTLLHGQCTKRSSKRSLCDLHQSEVI
jgi:hypothetical protein